MASIGLRLDHSTGGTELATMLAKAMYGDPMDQYKAANYLADMDYKGALTKAATEKANREQIAFGTKYNAANIIGDQSFYAHNQPVEVAPVAAAPAAADKPFVIGPQPNFPQPAAAAPSAPPTVAMRQPMPDLFGADAPVPVGPDTSILATTPPELRGQIAPTLPIVAEGRSSREVMPEFRLPGSYPFDMANHVGSQAPVPVEPDYRVSTFPMPQDQTWQDEYQGLGSLLGFDTGHHQGYDPRRPIPPIDMSQGAQVAVPGRNGPPEGGVRLSSYPMPGPDTQAPPGVLEQLGADAPGPANETWGQWLTRTSGLNKTMGVDPRGAPVGIDPYIGKQVDVQGRMPIDTSQASPSQVIPPPVAVEPDVRVATSSPNNAPVPVGPDTSLLNTPPAELNTIPKAGVEPQAPVAPAPEQGPPMPTPEQKQAMAIAATQPPAPVQQGQHVDHGDGTLSVGTKAGPLRMTREQWQTVARAGLLSDGDAAGQMQALLGTAGMLEDPNFGKDQASTFRDLTLANKGTAPGRESVYGTGEAIKLANATADNDPKKNIIEVNKRQYNIIPDPSAPGGRRLELIPGQPPAEGGVYGTDGPGVMRDYVDHLLVTQPDAKTWNPEQRQHYATMVSALYDAKVQVAANGDIVVTDGKLPPGVLPSDAGFRTGTLPPPTTAAPAGTPAATPAVAAPAAAGAEPAVAAPAAAPAAGQPDEHGRYHTAGPGGLDVKTYGGYLAPGQPARAPVKTDVGGGQTVQRVTNEEVTKEPSGEMQTQYNYTRNAITPATYLLGQTPENSGGRPNTFQRVLNSVGDDVPITADLIDSKVNDPQDRIYARNILDFVNGVAHKASGANLTKRDLATYSYLYTLPSGAKHEDYIDIQKRIIDNLKTAREGYNGIMPSETLRGFDTALAQAGIDLDWQPGTGKTPVRTLQEK